MTSEAKDIATCGLILRGLVGSTVHGLALEGRDDRDEMGVCLEPPSYVIGLRHFEQYVYRTQPEGVPSQPGDLDLTIYSLRKYASLAMKGNPTILLLLFTPWESLSTCTSAGQELRTMRNAFISRQAGAAFLGYFKAQYLRLLGLKGGRDVRRQELVEKYGYDTKYAMHALRLAHQGVALMQTGAIPIPVEEPTREYLMRVRRGEIGLKEVLEACRDMQAQLEAALASSLLPKRPDTRAVEAFLIRAYVESWGVT